MSLQHLAAGIALACALTGCATLPGDAVQDLKKSMVRTQTTFERCAKDLRTVGSAQELLRIEARYIEAGNAFATALDAYRQRSAQGEIPDEKTAREIEDELPQIAQLGGWLQAQRALFEDTERPGWRGAVCPKSGSAAAALQSIMAGVINDGDQEALLAGIDWDGVFEHTPERLRAGYAIKSSAEMRAFCQQLLQQPGDALLRPVYPLFEQAGLTCPEESERVRTAYARLGAAVKQDLDEGIAGWQTVNYVFGAERSTGQLAIVPVLMVEGSEASQRDLRLVKVGKRWVLVAEWLPPLLTDFLEHAFAREEAKEARAAVLALTKAALK